MFERTDLPHTGEICDALREIIGAKRSPLLGIITGVEPVDDGYPPRFSLPISGISPVNQEMAGGRLAKALTEELNRAQWSSAGCIASLSLQSSDATMLAGASSGVYGVDIDGLREYLGPRIAQTGLRPYALNLITVTFGKQWTYLSLICPRVRWDGLTAKEREAAYKQLRQDILSKFGVRLRVVLTTSHVGNSTKILPIFKSPTGDASRSTTASSNHERSCAVAANVIAPRALRIHFSGLADWSEIHLCSIDARGARRLEDVVGEGSESNEHEGTFDLRVCHPLALRDAQSLSPNMGVMPAIGMQALLAPSGGLLHGSVGIVAACNAHAIDVHTASSMLVGEHDSPAEDEQTDSLLKRTEVVLGRLHRMACQIRESRWIDGRVAFFNLGRAREGQNEVRIAPRAEVLVESLMRFSQRCIMNWRDSLPAPPSVLVSRPTVAHDRRSERLMSLLNCELMDLLDEAKMQTHSRILYERGGERLVGLLACVVHDAYCSRRIHVVDPDDTCRPGDVLPIKRGRFGQLNNIQVSLAALDCEPLSCEVIQYAWQGTSQRERINAYYMQHVFESIRIKQLELSELLAARVRIDNPRNGQ